MADLSGEAAARRHATDPRHLAVVADYVRPWPAARGAVRNQVRFLRYPM